MIQSPADLPQELQSLQRLVDGFGEQFLGNVARISHNHFAQNATDLVMLSFLVSRFGVTIDEIVARFKLVRETMGANYQTPDATPRSRTRPASLLATRRLGLAQPTATCSPPWLLASPSSGRDEAMPQLPAVVTIVDLPLATTLSSSAPIALECASP